MRLEGQHQPPLRPSTAHRFQHRLNLPRMMTVIVHQRRMPATGQGQFAVLLETPANALEIQ